ncbi:MAG TPA: tyrosine-type recombinase/integrase [Solirubrobacteraceae bacterium]
MRDGVLVAEVRVRGPLAAYAGGFAESLAGQGYVAGSVRLQVHLVAQLSRWLDGEGLDAAGLSELEAARFIAARRARVDRLFRSRRALEPLMGYLRGLGVVPAPAVIPLAPVEELLERYRRYLLVERALSPGTTTVYVTALRPFITTFESGERLELERLTAAEVNAFVLAEARRRPGTSIRSVATALRSLLTFLHVHGLVSRSLTGAVPGVGAWRQAGLPQPLERAELRRLLASCDRRTAVGRRDFAMLLLMGRLGLRCGEVAGLMLEDIDWRAGELIVYGKGRRDDRMPLPVDVGRAVAAYLRRGRPASALDRTVFVRTLAPHRRLTSSAVSRAVHYAAGRAGLGHLGAHRLRHTAATELLRAGATLPEVGQVLRHRRAFSTAIYAKVDDGALRRLARPWPEDRS